MNRTERRADTARIVGTMAILAGLLITGVMCCPAAGTVISMADLAV